jgi:hypothetical protein
MKHRFLLPHKFKYAGYAVFVFGLLLVLFTKDEYSWLNCKMFALMTDNISGDVLFFKIINCNLTYTIKSILVIVGGLLIAFSKEKVEDEFTAQMRLSSFQWAILVNYLILLFCFIFVYNVVFLNVLAYNAYTTLFFFVVRFNYLLFKNRKTKADEE